MNKKNILLTFSAIVLGIVIGILIKYAGVLAEEDTILVRILKDIGLIGNGFFLWTAICTIIAMLSKSKKLSAINVFLFLASMIAANYLYSYFVVKYFALRVVVFWIVMLIPCTFLGYYIWDIKIDKKIKNIKLKNATIIIGTAIMIHDMFVYPCLIQFLASAIIIAILYILFLLSILKTKKTVD